MADVDRWHVLYERSRQWHANTAKRSNVAPEKILRGIDAYQQIVSRSRHRPGADPSPPGSPPAYPRSGQSGQSTCLRETSCVRCGGLPWCLRGTRRSRLPTAPPVVTGTQYRRQRLRSVRVPADREGLIGDCDQRLSRYLLHRAFGQKPQGCHERHHTSLTTGCTSLGWPVTKFASKAVHNIDAMNWYGAARR